MGRQQQTGGAWLRAVATALTLMSAPFVMSTGAHAEVAAADPIDAAMRTCLARSDMSSTEGQVQCMQTARLGWLSAINVAYQQLQAKLPADQRKAWQESQKRWEASRDVQSSLLDAVFATTHGSAYQLNEADMQLQPVRDRALSLRSALAATSAGASAPRRLGPCTSDASCEHATFDMNRYYHRLQTRMPAHARPTLVKAQRAWTSYLDAAAAVTDERGRLDIIGARVATLKRLSDTVGND
jgi:uncharacterized protein YecT (DUF1311 family)